ncbi:MAG: hypothetical protein J0M03_16015 [Acidobacteria bacterium]|nr:hypothetical protein [Acidobacteriota bacterium]
MKKINYVMCIIFFLILHFGLENVLAQQRKVLYFGGTQSPSPELQEIVDDLCNTRTSQIPYNNLPKQTKYFVRIGERDYCVNFNPENKSYRLNNLAKLGTTPFVFITTPESIYGRSLLEIYQDIGYEAEEIISYQRGKDMVAIIFRYPDEYSFLEEKNAKLPIKWAESVYIPTWQNMFSLFSMLALDKENPLALDDETKHFIVSFTAEGKQRVEKTNYGKLKELQGDDWRYRDLLQKKMSVFKHFRGNGRTQNEVFDHEGTKGLGLPEFVGPNLILQRLPEIAVVDLGQLIIADTYSH